MTIALQNQMAAAERRVLELIVREGRTVLVNSPPGGGKTTLVESVCRVASLAASFSVAMVAPRAEQVYDLIRRIASSCPGVRIQVLLSKDRDLPPDLKVLEKQGRITKPKTPKALLPGPGVVVGTVAKLFHSVSSLQPGAFDLLVCDEAYQVLFKDLVALRFLAPRLLMVGDPGQLAPIVQGDIARFEAAPFKVHWPAPKEMLRWFPELDVVDLPATRRFPQDTVHFVQPAFYRDLPFTSAIPDDERQLAFHEAGFSRSPIDVALDRIAAGESIVGLVLPAKRLASNEVDPELSSLMARVADRVLERRARWVGAREPLGPGDLGVIDPHVASGAKVEECLRDADLSDEIMVSTAEVWQGLQRPLMVVKHPLSGLTRFEGFSLDPGRWCVMLSRHQVGCIIVARDGIGDVLERHDHDCSQRPCGAEEMELNGWKAHANLWRGLYEANRIVRL